MFCLPKTAWPPTSVGATGATGGRFGYANLYDTTAQVLILNDPVLFSNNGIIVPPGFITHTPGTAPIIINESGDYLITWEVFPGQGTSAFALFVDSGSGSVMIPGSNFGIRASNVTFSGQVIVTLTANSALTLRNINGRTTLNNDSSGFGPAVVSASIIIEKL